MSLTELRHPFVLLATAAVDAQVEEERPHQATPPATKAAASPEPPKKQQPPVVPNESSDVDIDVVDDVPGGVMVLIEEVGRCKLDPSLRAPPPRFQNLNVRACTMLLST